MKIKALVLGGLILGTALLAFFVQDFVRELLLYPLVYMYWSLRLVYEAVPGVIWWGLAILILVLLAVKSLSWRGERAQALERLDAHLLSRPQSWMQQIKKTRHGDYFKWQLAREISQLALSSIANQERLTLEQAQKRLVANQLDLPPKIQAYLEAGTLSRSYGQYTQLESQLRIPGTHSPLDLDLLDIVSFLESRLETS